MRDGSGNVAEVVSVLSLFFLFSFAYRVYIYMEFVNVSPITQRLVRVVNRTVHIHI